MNQANFYNSILESLTAKCIALTSCFVILLQKKKFPYKITGIWYSQLERSDFIALCKISAFRASMDHLFGGGKASTPLYSI